MSVKKATAAKKKTSGTKAVVKVPAVSNLVESGKEEGIQFYQLGRYIVTEEKQASLPLSPKGGMVRVARNMFDKMDFNLTLKSNLDETEYQFTFQKEAGQPAMIFEGGELIGKIVVGEKMKQDPQSKDLYRTVGAYYMQNAALCVDTTADKQILPDGNETILGDWKMMSSVVNYFVMLVTSGKWKRSDQCCVGKEGLAPSIDGQPI